LFSGNVVIVHLTTMMKIKYDNKDNKIKNKI
jgi:hypothetical protein